MTAVVGAFVQYLASFVFCVAVAGLGIFCGKKLRDNKNKKEA